MRPLPTLIHKRSLFVKQKSKIKRADVTKIYPRRDSRNAYKKRQIMTNKALPQANPFHSWDSFPASFLLSAPITRTATERIPRATPAQKGRNPGPGILNVPIPIGMEIKQTKTASNNQKKPLNWSRGFIIPPNTNRPSIASLEVAADRIDLCEQEVCCRNCLQPPHTAPQTTATVFFQTMKILRRCRSEKHL